MKKTFIILTLFLVVFSGCSWFKTAQEKAQEKKEETEEIVKNKLKEEVDEAVEDIFKSDEEVAIEKAQELFAQKKAEGLDMSDGPCLSNEIIPDWVADVAHDPRQDVDNLPENQCPAYREGEAHHFVELDIYGDVIKTY